MTRTETWTSWPFPSPARRRRRKLTFFVGFAVVGVLKRIYGAVLMKSAATGAVRTGVKAGEVNAFVAAHATEEQREAYRGDTRRRPCGLQQRDLSSWFRRVSEKRYSYEEMFAGGETFVATFGEKGRHVVTYGARLDVLGLRLGASAL